MKTKTHLQNVIVLACAAGAAFAAIYANTSLFSKNHPATSDDRERCYGVTKAGENDCATPHHSCAAQAKIDRDPQEWIMLPKGACKRLAGGSGD
jgi:uncharacterized membrane protein